MFCKFLSRRDAYFVYFLYNSIFYKDHHTTQSEIIFLVHHFVKRSSYWTISQLIVAYDIGTCILFYVSNGIEFIDERRTSVFFNYFKRESF
jgi:hypothetical protein